jgi:CheY-like chemotaxis protein
MACETHSREPETSLQVRADGVRGFLRTVLDDGGCDVTEAADGKQTLRPAREGHMNLVITDFIMPEQEDIETIRALRCDRPRIGIVAISGEFGGQLRKTAQLLGADSSPLFAT